jgi:hypothetical protein
MNCEFPEYRAPLWFPLHWRDEISGRLAKAVHAYLLNRTDNLTVTDEQIVLLRGYLRYYIHAPCWEWPEFRQELSSLRSAVGELDTATEIDEWIHKALEIGLDPL